MKDIRIKACVLGQVSTNCYVVYKESEKQAVIVDPGANGSYILNMCKELEVAPVAILLTHGHFDHVLAVEDLRRAFRVKVYAGEEEKALLENPEINLSASYGEPVSLEADVLLKDGEVFDLAGFQWKAIHTPGHTGGSLCYLVEDQGVLFSGDTLFYESYGRTDLPGGNAGQIVSSLKDRLFQLPDQVAVYPGHGGQTDIGHEKAHNLVFRYRG